jgi:two-component system response regulator HydG
VLERALILSGRGEIRPEHIQLPEPAPVRPGTAVGGGSLADVEHEMLLDALRRAGGNKSKAARLLGITRRVLYTKLRKSGLDTGDED